MQITCRHPQSVFDGIVLMLFPEQLIGIFNSDPSLMETAVPMFRVFFCMNFVMSFQMSAQNTFVAMGEAKKATFFALFRKVLLLIPLIYILPAFLPDKTTAVYLAEPVTDAIAVTCTAFLFAWQFKKALRKLEQPASVREKET